jgi:hypothetical protein
MQTLRMQLSLAAGVLLFFNGDTKSNTRPLTQQDVNLGTFSQITRFISCPDGVLDGREPSLLFDRITVSIDTDVQNLACSFFFSMIKCNHGAGEARGLASFEDMY